MTNSQPIEKLSLKPEKKKLTPKQIGGGILTAIALAGVLGSGGCAAKTPEIKSPTAIEAESTNTETQDEYIENMSIYKDMAIDEFELLPREERLPYGQYLIDQTVERGNYDRSFGKTDFGISPVEASVNNSAQEVLDIHSYTLQIAFLQFVESDKPQGQRDYDNLDGQKLLSYAFYDVGTGIVTNAYKAHRDYMNSIEKPGAIDNVCTEIDSSGLLVGVDSKTGDEVKYMDISYVDEYNVTLRARFVYFSFDSYKQSGSKSTWLMEGLGTVDGGVDEFSNIKPKQ